MRIVLAPDSFKGSLTSKQACVAMEAGIARVLPDAEIIAIPLSDGGEGLVDCLVTAVGGKHLQERVIGPTGQPVDATYGISNDGHTAFIEMAEASGITLIPEASRNPLLAASHGTGQLIQSALRKGCKQIVIGLGGSATNDGGAGMLEALGVKFLDRRGAALSMSGKTLADVYTIDFTHLDSRINNTEFIVVTDVDNPLCGTQGASYVFGPQKGGSADILPMLDQNLAHYAELLERQLDMNIKNRPGSGAAGGMGAALMAFFQPRMVRGIDYVLNAVRFEERVCGANLVITGEGQCDFQTLHGKTAFGVARAAKKYGIPTVIIAGSVGEGTEALYAVGVQSIISIVDRPMTLAEAISGANDLLTNATERLIRAMMTWQSTKLR